MWVDLSAADVALAATSLPEHLALHRATAAAFHSPYLAESVAAAVPGSVVAAAVLEVAFDIAAEVVGSAVEEASAAVGQLRTARFDAAARDASEIESDAAAALKRLRREHREQSEGQKASEGPAKREHRSGGAGNSRWARLLEDSLPMRAISTTAIYEWSWK